MAKVYMIRHAEAEGNLYRRIHGQYDSTVTDLGMRQIDALKGRFEGIDIDAVYASDMLRTQTTAKAVYAAKGLPLHTDPRLREVNMGAWEDLTWGEAERRDPEQLYNFHSDPENWRIEGGEPFQAVGERMVSAVSELAARHDGETIALFTHGTAIRTLLSHILKVPSHEIAKIKHCDNTAVTLLSVSKGRMEVIFKNDNSHLPGEISTFGRQSWWKRETGLHGGNMWFAPMDLEQNAQRYLAYRREAWMAAHETMEGYSGDYLELTKKYARNHPYGVTEAFLGDRPAGMLELAVSRGKEDSLGSIAFFYMSEEFRGKGMAVQLLGQAVSVYRPLGRDTLTLTVARENARAIGFYEKYGFIRTGETRGARGMLYTMEKDIEPRVR